MSIRQIYEKYNELQVSLDSRIADLETQIQELQKQKEDAVSMARDAATILQARGQDVPVVAKAAPARKTVASSGSMGSAASAGVAAHVASKSAVQSSGGSRPGKVHSMGIVEAAVHLAAQKGAKVANAGDVLTWFEEIGYTTRSGLPTRNSVYVSLNRESKKNDADVKRIDRGMFEFSAG